MTNSTENPYEYAPIRIILMAVTMNAPDDFDPSTFGDDFVPARKMYEEAKETMATGRFSDYTAETELNDRIFAGMAWYKQSSYSAY